MQQGLNLRPLPCRGSALPLSYAPQVHRDLLAMKIPMMAQMLSESDPYDVNERYGQEREEYQCLTMG